MSRLLTPILALACLVAAIAVRAGEIRFAPLPLVDEKGLRAEYLPLLDYLGARTGDTYRWTFHARYPDLLRAMQEDQVDLVVLGPLPYVKLMQQSRHFEPLVRFLEKDGRGDYDCVLLAFGTDRALKLRDIRGKRIGLTQSDSTCGYLAVASMLARAGRAPGKDGNRFEYAGNHTRAALGVAQGRYDVAGLKRSQADKYLGLDLHVIAQSGPYPAFALVANTRTLDAGRRAAIRSAILAADAGLRESWGESIRHGAQPVRDADYDHVRRLLKEIGPIPE